MFKIFWYIGSSSFHLALYYFFKHSIHFSKYPQRIHHSSLNVQNIINKKHKKLYPIVNKLSSMVFFYFGAICLQQTWLAFHADLPIFYLPSYNIIHRGIRCCKHDGLIICLDEMYSFKLRNPCNDSGIWEGLCLLISWVTTYATR